MTDHQPLLTDHQLLTIELISEGMSRQEIASELDVHENSVRKVVSDLCRRFGCSMGDLPARTRGIR